MNLLMISLHADPTVPAGIGEGGGTHSYIRDLLFKRKHKCFINNKKV